MPTSERGVDRNSSQSDRSSRKETKLISIAQKTIKITDQPALLRKIN